MTPGQAVGLVRPTRIIVQPDGRARLPATDAERLAGNGLRPTQRRRITYFRRAGDSIEASTDQLMWLPWVTVPGLTDDFSATADNLDRPAVCWLLPDGTCNFMWFDQTLGRYDTLSTSGINSAMVNFDFSEDTAATWAEMLWFYTRSGVCYYRKQLDRFTIEHTFGPCPPDKPRITGLGMGRNWRLHVRFGDA